MAKIYQLLFCSTCRNRIKENESFTEWEKEVYCEPCFDEYMELVTPKELSKSKNEDE